MTYETPIEKGTTDPARGPPSLPTGRLSYERDLAPLPAGHTRTRLAKVWKLHYQIYLTSENLDGAV